MSDSQSAWVSDVSRGPDWLFVRVDTPPKQDGGHLAEDVVGMMQRHFLHRVVLEMEEIDRLPSELVGELVLLHKRVSAEGGMMRLSGLSDANQQVLRISRLDSRFPQYRSRMDAVMGHRREHYREHSHEA